MMEDMQETLLGLFTEVAILEHLVRNREGHSEGDELSNADFGVLNYFILNHPSPDSVAGIAWCFQEEEDYTRSKIESLAARDMVTLTPDTPNNIDAMVMITDLGREAHTKAVAKIAPDIELAVAEIPREDLETTFKTLRNIRLTLDNLPDR
jgi:DNA-binding MarR family transcriptional regulator